jgi:F-box-like
MIAEWHRAGLVLQRVPIGSLPDDVLLEIFYQVSEPNHYRWLLNWTKLVHVCRRWRFVIFGSPKRLELQLFCTPKVPVRKLLDIWPTFPLVVENDSEWSSEDKFDNFIAALEHRDRVQKITIRDPLTRDGLWERIATVMQEPYPELTSLSLESFSGVLPLPNTFLNGSTSRLQGLLLWAISFPSLPRLLLSTRRLTSLHLINIPNSGYIPPERMATCLSALPMLESLIIRFQSPTPHPKRRNRPLPPPTRFVLPALTELDFRGISEYLEVLAARIDAPLLKFDRFQIVFFNQLVLDIPQTIRFFGHLDSFRTASLTLRFNTSSGFYPEAVFFPSDMAPHPLGIMGQRFSWHIRCNSLDWQVFLMAQICSQILSFCSSVESLVIEYPRPPPKIKSDEIDPTVWLQLFHSFPLVQRLQIPVTLELSIAAALQRLTEESATEVFLSLHTLSIVGRMSDEVAPQGILSYVAACHHNGRLVAISRRSE